MRKGRRGFAIAASLVAVITMLMFPLLGHHHFSQRIRQPQRLSQFQRHIFAGQPEGKPVELGPIQALPTIFLVDGNESIGLVEPVSALRVVDHVPVPRLLLRLKLCSRRDSGQDPLL